MAFWGAVVKPGKPHAFVPPPEDWNLHLSQAALEPTVPEGQRVAVAVKADPEDDSIILCTLTAGRTDTAPLDMFFSQYSEFTVMGDHPVHLTGYYTPAQNLDDDDDDEGEDDDDDEYQPKVLGFPMHARDGDDEDDDEDDEDEDMDGLDEDEDEDEDDDDDELAGDDEMFGYPVLSGRRRPQVVITDITDEGKDAPKGKDSKGGKGGATTDGKKKGKTEGVVEMDEDDESNDDDDEEEEEDDDEDDEEDEEEEEEQPTPPAKGGKQAAPASNKRPAESPAVANGAAKADQPAKKKQAVGQQQPQPAAKGKDAKVKQQLEPKPEAKPEPKQKPPKPEAKPEPKQETPKDAKAGKKNIRRHPNGFEVEDVAYGNPNAKLAKPGHKVMMRYVGRIKSNGKVFDKSGAKPFQFRLGVGEVIKGWDLGVEGMRVGDKRRLVIPPQLAYGTSGIKGTIPPNATLDFDVELVDVK